MKIAALHLTTNILDRKDMRDTCTNPVNFVKKNFQPYLNIFLLFLYE